MDDERGPCLVCQLPDAAYFAGRGEGPYCWDHGPAVARGLAEIEKAQRGPMLAARRAEYQQQGREYWDARGIAVGARVVGTLSTFLGPFGPVQRLEGIARVGIVARGPMCWPMARS